MSKAAKAVEIVGKRHIPVQQDLEPDEPIGAISPRLAGRPPTPAPEMDPLDSESSEPIERQVYVTLRRAMMSGALLPGARISSRSIARSLGVSSMPVREALKRLESDGAISSSQKSAFFVAYPTVAEFNELLRIRLELEVMLAREATPKISKIEIERAHWLQERMAQSRSYGQILGYNYKMHFLIYRAAEMPYALSLVENIWVKIGPILHAIYGDKKMTAILFDHHHAIVDGLRAGDAAKVESAIRADLQDAAIVILRALQGR